jgi:hypothetical protein
MFFFADKWFSKIAWRKLKAGKKSPPAAQSIDTPAGYESGSDG